ncbi:hypothetical protein BN1013_00957 [Candidatus Rubidus massiliensis]|nr:MAG: hypothetical protein BGO10_07050 [Chlamydia sp. 32-24]CDZ80445.1 hypothetical protein BN1013_00957 [Candidatus Rubidus massiliensis]
MDNSQGIFYAPFKIIDDYTPTYIESKDDADYPAKTKTGNGDQVNLTHENRIIESIAAQTLSSSPSNGFFSLYPLQSFGKILLNPTSEKGLSQCSFYITPDGCLSFESSHLPEVNFCLIINSFKFYFHDALIQNNTTVLAELMNKAVDCNGIKHFTIHYSKISKDGMCKFFSYLADKAFTAGEHKDELLSFANYMNSEKLREIVLTSH